MRLIALAIAACAALFTAATAHAQTAGKVPRIAFVSPVSPGFQVEAFRQGLREAGYVEGKTILLEQRYAEGRVERLPSLFAEVLALKVDVVLAGSTPGAIAAKRATTTVPVVFGGVLDPVGSGIVASLARPGGNITGVTVGVGGEGFTGKCLELLREMAPGLSHIAVLLNPANPFSAQVKNEIPAAGRALGMKFDVHEVTNAKGLESAFAAIAASDARAIFVAPDTLLTDSSPAIAKFASARRLPSIHFSRRYAEAGGLMSYGGNLADSYRRAAVHVDRILKGAKPADLPVEQPTRFELVINARAANAMGLKTPPALRLRADHIIE
jgi:putative tryptophan/tyrosine transport system substrate-binding protein